MSAVRKERLDVWLVERGLAPSRDEARRRILAGEVRVDDRPADKPGRRYPETARVEVVGEPRPYVGRGGLKLRHALDVFGIDPSGMTALDIGASTGGFTDCLLQAGARRVYAVDVGRNQLDWRLRNDERVVSLEKTNARHPLDEPVPDLVDLVVIDVSFISLDKVLDAAVGRLAPGGRLVALVKPQFEVGPSEVGKGGVVRDPALHDRVVAEARACVERRGLTGLGVVSSPILGAGGNREFLLAARRGIRAPSEPAGDGNGTASFYAEGRDDRLT